MNVLRSMRGSIVDARIAYPEILHLEVRDARGDLWRLATQDAQWSPADPAQLLGRSIEDADIDEGTGELRCGLSDGTVFRVKPAAVETEDDPPNWELLSPAGIVLSLAPEYAGRSVALTRRPHRVAERTTRRPIETPQTGAALDVAHGLHSPR